MTLKLGTVVCDAGGFLEHAYFPQGSVLSLLTVLENGSAVECANIGREGTFGLFAAMAAERMLGYGAAEMIGKPLICLFPPELVEEEERILERLRRGERIEHYETVRLTKDGQPMDLGLTISPIREASGKIVAASTIIRDLTEQKRTDMQFGMLADLMPTICWMANADGWIYWYNRLFYDYTGTTSKLMAGWGWQAVHDPAVLPTVLESWKGCIESGQPFEVTFPLKGAHGVFRPFLTRVTPLRGADGRIFRWLGVHTDVTEERKDSELREQFMAVLGHDSHATRWLPSQPA